MNWTRTRSIAVLGMAVLVAVASLAGGVLFLAGHGSVDTGGRAMELGVGVALLLAAGAMGMGVRRSLSSSSKGGGLIAAGAVPVAICFWWTGIVPVVSASVVAASVIRIRRASKEMAGST